MAGGVFSVNGKSSPTSTLSATECGISTSTGTASATPSVIEGVVLGGDGGSPLLNGCRNELGVLTQQLPCLYRPEPPYELPSSNQPTICNHSASTSTRQWIAAVVAVGAI